MRIVIIGSGNVASVLGRLFVKNNHEILQVVSRNAAHAQALAAEFDCGFADYEGAINKEADLYLVAVVDSALYDLNNNLHLGNKLILHTAGSVSKDVLKQISINYGVLYPLQSLRKEMEYTREIPFLIDGNTDETITLIKDFAGTFSGHVVKAADDERLKLHVAAVVVSNFSNHLYAMAEKFCIKENVDFKLLLPLIKETAGRIEYISPAEVQTGPAMRKDVFTLDKHLRVLSDHPALKYIYLKLTDSIMKS
ncbi:MAG: DUF2520 domain-containing protein [Chitinophagaceae bacterium]|nr:DUF2520 domain-containing protein [Chitinophagaceae bacterium]MBK9530454.1 DUF2520 domain-containing protein [Chitinophagaceae bacterium]